MWPVVKLGELASREDSAAIAIGPFGSRMKADSYVPVGVPVIRGQNFSDSGGIAGEYVHITSEFATSLGSANLLRDDIVFPHRGSIGRVARVPADGYVMSTSLMRIRLDPLFADPRFVVAYFGSDLGRAEILQFASTVGTPGIGQPLTSLRQFQMPLPPLDEQRRIAEVLGALDDLIDTNERTISQLGAFADELFRKAETNGDWKAFADVVDVFGGGTPSTSDDSFWNGDVPWATPTDLTALRSPYLFSTAKMITDEGLRACSSRLNPVGSVLMTSRATIGRIAVAQVPVATNQGFIVLHPRHPTDGVFFYHELRKRVDEFISRANGSTFLEISRGTFKALKVKWPTAEARAELFASLSPLHEAAVGLERENETLRRTRDELLPLLISGTVRVRPEAVSA